MLGKRRRWAGRPAMVTIVSKQQAVRQTNIRQRAHLTLICEGRSAVKPG